jgi:hypothetical protein
VSKSSDGLCPKPLSEYLDRFPGRKSDELIHLSTLVRWAVVGKRAPDGTLVKLEAYHGAVWTTCDRWVDEFIERLKSPGGDGTTVVPAPRSPAERNRAADAADEELDDLGVG